MPFEGEHNMCVCDSVCVRVCVCTCDHMCVELVLLV